MGISAKDLDRVVSEMEDNVIVGFLSIATIVGNLVENPA